VLKIALRRSDGIYDRILEMQKKAPRANISTCDDKPCVQVIGEEYTNKKGDRFYHKIKIYSIFHFTYVVKLYY